MFSELVELGHRLDSSGKLPPAGFSSYHEPVKWILHLWSDRALLEPVDISLPRPFGGRTSGVEAHLLADEAGYVLGIDEMGGGTLDKRAARKHADYFRPLYQAFSKSSSLKSPELREAINWLDRALDENWLRDDPHLADIRSKDWITIVPEDGALTDTHLFMHIEAKSYWVEEMKRRCIQAEDVVDALATSNGQCAICGAVSPLVRKLPLKVKLASATPLHSLNLSAFTSFVGGPSPEKRTHLGMCFDCAELSARAFNFMSDSGQYRMQIVRHPHSRDSLTNQYALYWLKAPGTMVANKQEFELTDDESAMFTVALSGVERMSESTLQQMTNLLKTPWVPRDHHLKLDDFEFYLAILSPNVGRVAMREWLPLSIDSVKESLAKWLNGTRMVFLHREELPQLSTSIRSIVDALGDVNAEMSRALIHTAYGKSPPPNGLLYLAGKRLNVLNAMEHSLRDRGRHGEFWKDDWPHALASAIRLVRNRPTEEGQYMSDLSTELPSPAYHCGRLLAVLEEAQQVYTYHQMGKRLDVSIVQRGYGGACSTPSAVIGRMYKLASTAHLPEAGKYLNVEVEAIAAQLVALGGMPKRLNNNQQADFGLGFYQQKARIRQYRNEKPPEEDANEDPEF